MCSSQLLCKHHPHLSQDFFHLPNQGIFLSSFFRFRNRLEKAKLLIQVNIFQSSKHLFNTPQHSSCHNTKELEGTAKLNSFVFKKYLHLIVPSSVSQTEAFKNPLNPTSSFYILKCSFSSLQC